MNRRIIVIADADAIVAQAYAEDVNHERILSLSQKLTEQGAHILFPATVIAEAVTTLQRKFSNPNLASVTLELFTDPDITLENVDGEILREAKQLFNPNASKHNTIFDCIVATIAKRRGADAIFSFDGWYEKLGFKLVSGLV